MPATKEVIENQPIEVTWDIIKYIAAGLVSLVSMFSLWILGKFKNEHEIMFKKYIEKESDIAKKLEEREIKEMEDILTAIKEIKHDINAIRQERVNMEIFSRRLDEVEKRLELLEKK